VKTLSLKDKQMIRTVLLAVVTATSIGIADASFGQVYYSHSGPQGVRSTLPERLGYPADAKLLIVHADDLGMAHSVAWRQRDLQFFTGDTFRRLLQENHIKLVTWREIGEGAVPGAVAHPLLPYMIPSTRLLQTIEAIQRRPTCRSITVRAGIFSRLEVLPC